MSDAPNTIEVCVTDPESLARGLLALNENAVAVGRAVSTLATILGITIAMTDRPGNKATLTDALFAALDKAGEAGLDGAMIENLRSSLQAGCNCTRPPDGGKHLTIIRSDEDERKAA
jgi:hypothetical protein